MKARPDVELAPLNMVRSYYPIIEFEANPKFSNRDISAPLTMNLLINHLEFNTKEDNPNTFIVVIELLLQWPDESDPPYLKARLLCVGEFQFNENTPDDNRDRQKFLAAPSMLYSGAREFLKYLTVNGPYRPVILPGAVFKMVPIDSDNGEPHTEQSQDRPD